MAQNLAQNLIDLGNWSLCPDYSPELCLYPRKYTFRIRPLMIMLQKDFPIELVEMPHTIPQDVEFMMMVSHTSGIDLEEDKGRPTNRLNYYKMAPAGLEPATCAFTGGQLGSKGEFFIALLGAVLS